MAISSVFNNSILNLNNQNVTTSGFRLVVSGTQVGLIISDSGNLLSRHETGQFYPLSNPNGYLTTGEGQNIFLTTGEADSIYVRQSQTGNFATTGFVNSLYYLISNPSGYLNSLSGLSTGYVLSVSGSLVSLINNSSAGVSTLNTLSGGISLVGVNGINISSSGQNIFISGLNLLSGYITTGQSDLRYYPIASNPSGYLSSLSGLSIAYTTGLSGILNQKIDNSGSVLDNKINALSGNNYLVANNLSGYITTGLSDLRYYPITSNPSGYLVSLSGLSIAYTTGLSGTLNQKIDSLSGYSSSAFDLALTGSNLSIKIDSTGSLLDSKINALSGNNYLLPINISGYITTGQADLRYYLNNNPSGYLNSLSGLSLSYTTGLSGVLDQKINSLSGVSATVNNLFLTGSSLSSGIDLLSSNYNNLVVLKTGLQNITGEKTFINRVVVGDTGSTIYTHNLAGPIFGTNIKQGQVTILKTSGDGGIHDALYASSYYEFPSGETTFGIIGNVTDLGNQYSFGDHAVGVLGLAANTSSGKRSMVGVEGRVFVKGDASAGHAGVWAFADYVGDTITGEMVGVQSRISITKSGEGTPTINSGSAISYKASKIEGGDPSLKFSFLGYDPIRNFNRIDILNTGGTAGIIIQHANGSASVQNTLGNFSFALDGGSYLTLDGGVGFAPLQAGKSLGIEGLRWVVYGESGNFSNIVKASNFKVENSILITGIDTNSGLFSVNNNSGLITISSTGLASQSNLAQTGSYLYSLVLGISGNGGGGSGSPGGANGEIQYNNNGNFAGASNANIQNGDLVLKTASSFTVPETGYLKIFSRSIAGRLLPAFVGPAGLDSALQVHLGRNKVGYWSPPGNANTAPTAIGLAAPTATGTATARNVATTNLFTSMRRLGYVSAATSGQAAGLRLNQAQFFRGNQPEVGGFHYVCRFGISDAAAVAQAKMWVGMTSSTVPLPANRLLTGLANSIGLVHEPTEQTFSIYHNDGSGPATVIPLGTGFPCTGRSVDAYDFSLFCPPNANYVGYQVQRLGYSAVATGVITTKLPVSTTLLAPQLWRANGTTAAAVALDFISLYIETDY